MKMKYYNVFSSIEKTEEELEELGVTLKDIEVIVSHLQKVEVKLNKLNLNLFQADSGIHIMHDTLPSHIYEIPHQENSLAFVAMTIDGGEW